MEDVVQEHTPGNVLILHCYPSNDHSKGFVGILPWTIFHIVMIVSSISCRSSESHCPIEEYVLINITLLF